MCHGDRLRKTDGLDGQVKYHRLLKALVLHGPKSIHRLPLPIDRSPENIAIVGTQNGFTIFLIHSPFYLTNDAITVLFPCGARLHIARRERLVDKKNKQLKTKRALDSHRA